LPARQAELELGLAAGAVELRLRLLAEAVGPQPEPEPELELEPPELGRELGPGSGPEGAGEVPGPEGAEEVPPRVLEVDPAAPAAGGRLELAERRQVALRPEEAEEAKEAEEAAAQSARHAQGGAGFTGAGVALPNGDVFDHCTLLMFWNVPVARKPRKPSGRFPSCAVKSMIVRNFSELRSRLSLSLKRM
jgi:hypothetical protein